MHISRRNVVCLSSKCMHPDKVCSAKSDHCIRNQLLNTHLELIPPRYADAHTQVLTCKHQVTCCSSSFCLVSTNAVLYSTCKKAHCRKMQLA